MAKKKSAVKMKIPSKKASAKKPAAIVRPTWTVDEALDEVIQEIRKGCLYLIKPAVEKALTALYRPDFDAQYKKNADWKAARIRVLPLSRLVGTWALSRTLMKASKGGSIPTTVDQSEALAEANDVAAAKICPVVKFSGAWCAGLIPKAYAKKAARELRSLMGSLKLA